MNPSQRASAPMRRQATEVSAMTDAHQSMTAAVREPSQMQQSLDACHALVETLNNDINRLEGRLRPILQPASPSPASPNVKEDDVYRHCVQLRLLALRVQDMSRMVNDIEQRLDV